MNEDPFISELLAQHRPVVDDAALWAKSRMRLRVRSYLSPVEPPHALVTSARAVVWRDAHVLVMRNRDSTHILPGGRLERGETPEAALRRELLEETGQEVAEFEQLGFMWLHHQTPKPADYPYVYPDFFWPIYRAETGTARTPGPVAGDYELEATFRPHDEVRRLKLTPAEHCYLDAAVDRCGPR